MGIEQSSKELHRRMCRINAVLLRANINDAQEAFLLAQYDVVLQRWQRALEHEAAGAAQSSTAGR